MSSKDFASATFKDKPDMSMIWLRHMDRVNASSVQGIGYFESFVRQQLRLLPTQSQAWVLSQKDKYEEDRLTLVYQKRHGRVIGQELSPALRNTDLGIPYDDDGEIDYNHPNVISPKLELKPFTDYEALNLLILTAAERDGLSWKVQMHTRDMGDVDKTKKKRSLAPIHETDTGKKYANNPRGLNTRIISTIPDTNLNIIDWHGTKIVEGPGYGPLFLNMVQTRTNAEKGTIIGVGGPPGEGKTYWAVRLAEILNRVKRNRKFNPYIQMPFESEHFLWLLSENSPLKPGDVIILDEAHFAAGSRNWFKEDQKELVNMIASARNMGYIIILIVLHMSMLDNILRNFVMSFYIHLERVGRATAYLTYTRRFDQEMMKNTIGPVTLMLPGVGECEHPFCLHCKHLYPKNDEIKHCFVNRAIYERRKRFFQNRNVERAMKRRKIEGKKAITDNDLINKLHEFHHELILTSHGNVDSAIIQIILDRELEVPIGKHKGRDLAKRYKLLYPNSVYNT